MILVEEENKTGKSIPWETKLYKCHYFMTSGGIPLNHRQDVSTNRAQLFYGFMRILLKCWNVTGEKEMQAATCRSCGPTSEGIQWGWWTDSCCAKWTVPLGTSDISRLQKGGAQPGSQWHLLSWLQTCKRFPKVPRPILFSQSSPQGFYTLMILPDVFLGLTLPIMFLWGSLLYYYNISY